MPYSLAILWRERGRYLPAVLAVAFSAVLVCLQSGLLFGFLGICSRPVDSASADIWIASPDVMALGYSHPIPEAWLGRLAAQPEVTHAEPFLYGFGQWHKPDGGQEQCFIIGSRLDDDAVGRLADLPADVVGRLARPGAVAVFGPDRARLGVTADNSIAEVAGQRVDVVGVLRDNDKGAGLTPGIVCSLRTARRLLPDVGPHQAHYLIGRCRTTADADAVASRLRGQFPSMAVLTKAEFAKKTQNYWLTQTRAGLVLAFAAVLGLVVGAVITSQTLYAATLAMQRELAVLRALGIPRWRVASLVLSQAAWVAALGVGIGLPLTLALGALGEKYGVEPKLSPELLAWAAALTATAALGSGLFALRSVNNAEPMSLLR